MRSSLKPLTPLHCSLALCVAGGMILLSHFPANAHADSATEVRELIANGDDYIALEKINKQLEENPQDYEFLLLNGQLELNRGNYKKGIALLSYANKVQPEDYRAKYQLGLAYLRHRAYLQADEYLSEALLLNPHDKKIQSLHFLALVKSENPSISPREKLASYPLRTEFPETYFIHAVWHFSQGDIDKAAYFVSAVSDLISLNDMLWYQRWLSTAGWTSPRDSTAL